jgi:hypothetical protein
MTSPFISSNIPASPAYAVYISHLIHYSEVCAQYIDFLDRVLMQTQKLLKQDYACLPGGTFVLTQVNLCAYPVNLCAYPGEPMCLPRETYVLAQVLAKGA